MWLVFCVYFLHCFCKLWEYHQHIGNNQLCDVSPEYQISLCFQGILGIFQERQKMEHPLLGHFPVYIVNPYIENSFVLLRFCISNLLESFVTSLYAGAFFQLTIGLTGECVLCIFIKPLIVSGEGLRYVYFHFLSSLHCESAIVILQHQRVTIWICIKDKHGQLWLDCLDFCLKWSFFECHRWRMKWYLSWTLSQKKYFLGKVPWGQTWLSLHPILLAARLMSSKHTTMTVSSSGSCEMKGELLSH